MIMILSYIIAVIISAILACILYPISAFFYVVGVIGNLIGKIGNGMFSFTNHVVRKLWSDLNSEADEIGKTSSANSDVNTKSNEGNSTVN